MQRLESYKPPHKDVDGRDDRNRVKRTWRHGVSKRHKVMCQQCGNLLHERGKHLSPGTVQFLLDKRQREVARAAACGYEAGQRHSRHSAGVKPTRE